MKPARIVNTSSLRFVPLLAVVLASVTAGADLPGAKDPDAYTLHAYGKEALDFHRHTMSEAYKRVGRRDAKWDDAALAFFDALAVNFTYHTMNHIYQPKEYPSLERCGELARAAIDKGCDDPLLLLLHTRVLELIGKSKNEVPGLYRRAHAALNDSKYPPERRAHAARHAMDYAPEGQREALTRDRDEHLLEAAAGPFINRGHRRMVLSLLLAEFTNASVDAKLAFYERLKGVEDADGWIVNVFGGNACIRAAWRARGHGFADTVTEQGWRGFFTNFAEAEKLLTAAWKLRPDHPEAPTLMIQVAMGGGERVAGSPRQWFERAVAAQLDHAAAYSRMFEALLPRWGGSHESMLEFGLECARTERYDTDVPYQFVLAIENIRHDARDPSLWKVPETYESATRVLDRYAETYKDHPSGPWYRSFHAALAWRHGKYAEARELLDQLGDQVDAERFSNFGGSIVSVAEVYARSGPHAADVAKALDLVHHHKFKEALHLFRAIDAKVDDADKSNSYLKDRIVFLDRGIRFEAGEWVNLLPTDDLLTGFAPNNGTWRVDDRKRLVGASDSGNGLFVLCNFITGPRYEVSVTLARPEEPAKRTARASVVFNYDYTNRGDMLMLTLDYAENKAELSAYGQPVRAVNGSLADPVTVHIECWNDRSQVRIDGLGQPIRHRRPEDAHPLRVSVTGVAAPGPATDGVATLYVTEWKIRRLDKAPFSD